jgi:predicted polyphosphate/ATP-dependent NAD kinase
LRVDTGDAAIDEMLSGYIRVVTAYNREIVYRIAS